MEIQLEAAVGARERIDYLTFVPDGEPTLDIEYLVGYEGDAFASSGDPVTDLLSITAVHPMREEAVRALLARTGKSWDIVQRMIDTGKLRENECTGRKFYLRRFSRSSSSA